MKIIFNFFISLILLLAISCSPKIPASTQNSSNKYFDPRVEKASKTQDGWVPFERQLTAKDFGAIPNDGKDDTKALQEAFDFGDIVIEKGRYIVSSTLFIKKHCTQIKGQSGIEIVFTGSDSAINSKKVNNTYPVSCEIKKLNITLTKPNQVGFDIKLSYSDIHNCSVKLSKNNNIGFRINGDSKGTGSYYNTFYRCNVQGNVQVGSKNQKGIEFSFDKSYPTRCPNANIFIGGRVGQVTQGIIIRGAGNNFYSPILEGNLKQCIIFNHPTSKVGCVSNNVYSPYIEGNTGATAAFFGKNSLNCQVLNPFITSLGIEGKIMEDMSIKQSNGLIVSEDISESFSRNKQSKSKSQNRDVSQNLIQTGVDIPKGNAPNGTLYSRTIGGGELYFRQNGTWVKIK